MQLGMIGLGRMGGNMVERLMKAGHRCVVYDRSPDTVRAYAAKGWQVVGLAIDSEQAVGEFLKRTPVTYPIGVAGMDGAELMLALGNGHGALPFTVVFDADGRVIEKRLGETRYDELVQWASRG